MIHNLKVREIDISNARERKRFIKVPWKIYHGDRYWVPPLIGERMEFLDPARNESFEHLDTAFFVAEGFVTPDHTVVAPQPGAPGVVGSEQMVGSIGAFVNHRHNAVHDENVGFFGFFEAVNDYDVVEALLQTACDWVRQRGVTAIRGPASFTGNDDAYGTLVDGFDSRPVVLMSYNPPYYPEMIECFGFRKAMDLWAWYVNISSLGENLENLPPKLVRIVDLARKRSNVRIRSADTIEWDELVAQMKMIYNSAWERNWGFVPFTDAEIDHVANGLRQFADLSIVSVADIDGEPVGFSLPLPDMNIAVHHMNGRLFPIGWLKYLWYKRQVDWLRIFALGVIKKYRGRGIDAILYYETAKAAAAKGYRHAEMSWILENNDMMNRGIKMFGAEVYKTYRIYEMAL
jgi:GNAT superfamily N-acetyltransferase